jgi:monofunctional biosynthetic peptidoglycan transglycosylase
MKLKAKIIIQKASLVLLACLVLFHALFLIAGAALMFRLREHNPAYGTLMLYRQHQGESVRPLTFVPLEELPASLRSLTVAVEDVRFHEHAGIDIDAIKWAYYINMKVGYHMYGASTITQQITRTLLLVPKKLLVRKYLEVLLALEMDLILSKERILELYLNYAEWGPGIFGFANAAEYHYGLSYDRCSTDQISRLIAILANPLDYDTETFFKKKFLANRYYTIKFRYYTFLKFQKDPGFAYNR